MKKEMVTFKKNGEAVTAELLKKVVSHGQPYLYVVLPDGSKKYIHEKFLQKQVT